MSHLPVMYTASISPPPPSGFDHEPLTSSRYPLFNPRKFPAKNSKQDLPYYGFYWVKSDVAKSLYGKVYRFLISPCALILDFMMYNCWVLESRGFLVFNLQLPVTVKCYFILTMKNLRCIPWRHRCNDHHVDAHPIPSTYPYPCFSL